MTNAFRSLILAALLFCANVPASSAPQSANSDPFTGTWKLNPQKSSYPRDACPKRMVIVMEPMGQGIHYRSETTYANGNSTRAEYSADYSGKQAIVTGSAGLLLPVSLKRVDAYTVIARYTRGLQIVATSRRVVSRDGKLMTVTTTSPDQLGKNVTSVGVYEKVGEIASARKESRQVATSISVRR